MKIRVFDMSTRLIGALMPPLLLSLPGFAAVLSVTPLTVSLQKDPTLALELSARVKTDQDARNAWIKFMQTQKPGKQGPKDVPEVIKRLKKIDAENLAWLKKVVDEKGWPGKTKVGTEGGHNTWLLVQHCDEDKPFQKKFLKLMEALLPTGD